jgi:hypothetical protein
MIETSLFSGVATGFSLLSVVLLDNEMKLVQIESMVDFVRWSACCNTFTGLVFIEVLVWQTFDNSFWFAEGDGDVRREAWSRSRSLVRRFGWDSDIVEFVIPAQDCCTDAERFDNVSMITSLTDALTPIGCFGLDIDCLCLWIWFLWILFVSAEREDLTRRRAEASDWLLPDATNDPVLYLWRVSGYVGYGYAGMFFSRGDAPQKRF